ncbi:DUF881 domain-containing protein [Clostridium algidicarnis]|uniref:DUF881 domain-containing protein n=1 Tax=Clostridium algidicarnis TaxID=37659 RepID=UPI001C0AF754|nr:DUF881 domain-containing protein [Clostridium algidicarnis]MBU3195497.1 DUF881 domain-containing protein [Clostridium algidicarnis]MBU3208457.1 DUF881 domain-containing protein [Clostridium algidicarnis]MBU3226947.1 DUF881 domain-containing protein [Clostridium algidicarnis]MBU3250142.1 DUF881 domain-containing protein [Clostridium algidicarnis]
MKLNEGKIFIFIAAVMIGILVSFNINLSKDNKREYVSTKEYQEIYNKRNKLYREVSDAREDYQSNYKKLNSFKSGYVDKEKNIADSIVEELENNKILLGYNKVQGNGIEITVRDGFDELNPDIEDPLLRYMRTFHNTDLIQIINELKLFGAEAISINGQRLMSNSEVYCSSAFISINGVKLPAPFHIEAIGNTENLVNSLKSNDSYLKRLQGRGINIDIEEKETIVIPPYIGDLKVNFLSSKKNK